MLPPLPKPVRAAVVGITGSGKTTLARRLAERFCMPHVELDALYWGSNWTPRPTADFLTAISEALSGAAWVVDGNYREGRPIVWAQANTLIWLDYSLPLCLWRLTKRIWRRGLGREQLWNGNRETIWPHYFTRDSLYLWALQTYWRYRRQYVEDLQRPENAHLQLLRFKLPSVTGVWLAQLSALPAEAGVR